MALFKICRGNESNLPTTLTDGYAYFCTDTGNFYIDWADSDGNVSREHISAEYATKLRYKDDNGEWVEIDAKDLTNTNITVDQVQADYTEVDPNEPSFIKNKIVGYKPDFVPESSWTFSPDSLWNYPNGPKSTAIDEEGIEFIVTWDGVDYPCVSTKFEWKLTVGGNVTYMTYLAIGNPALMDYANGISTLISEANGLPFFIGAAYSFAETAGEHSVRIRYADDIIKLDKKFMPDDFTGNVQPNWDETDTTSGSYIQNKPTFADVATSGSYTDLKNTPSFSKIATSGKYDDLIGQPELKRVAVGGSYNDLKDRLFGNLVAPLEETELTFEVCPDDSFFAGKFVNELSLAQLVEGESYTVNWGGTVYTLTAKLAQDAVSDNYKTLFDVGDLYLGNATLLWYLGEYDSTIADTGEPFAVWFRPDEIGYDVIFTSDTEKTTRTVSITAVNEYIKLDSKYLPDEAATKEYVQEEIAKIEVSGGDSFTQVQSDWNETNENSSAFIKNKPEVVTAADVVAMLASAGVVVPVAVKDNLLLADSNNDIYIL